MVSLSELYDRYAGRLYAYACVLVPSREEAEDVVQECFLRLARRKGRLAAVENLEREMILESLKASHGHQGQAARMLGITLRMLGYKIRKYGIDPKVYAGKGVLT